MSRYHILARPDGTDLLTGTVRLELGATACAPAQAPFPLGRSAIELVELGAWRDEGAAHAPWRVFAVEALRLEWDYDAALKDGWAHLIGFEVRVLAELPLAELLGFEPATRARDLTRGLLARAVPAAGAALDDAQLAAHVAELFTRCAANGLCPSIAEYRALPVRCTFARSAELWRCDCGSELQEEAGKVWNDVEHLAASDPSGAVLRYRDEADAAAERFDAWAGPCDGAWPRALRSSRPQIDDLGPGSIIRAWLLWELVDPLLSAPPGPLTNLFAPLAEIVLGGAILIGWTEDACVLYRPSPAGGGGPR